MFMIFIVLASFQWAYNLSSSILTIVVYENNKNNNSLHELPEEDIDLKLFSHAVLELKGDSKHHSFKHME